MSSCLPKKAQVLEFKHGDTFVLGCAVKDADGVAVSLVGVEIKAQMRPHSDLSILTVTFEVKEVDYSLGTYELWHPGNGLLTADPGDYVIDIEYSETIGSRVITRSSRTFYVRVLEGVSEGALT